MKEKYLKLVIKFLRNRKGSDAKKRFLASEKLSESEIDEMLMLPDIEPPTMKNSPGASWPIDTETMTYEANLDFLLKASIDIIIRGIEGDIIETGVWKGGCILFMKTIFDTYNDSVNRNFFVCDSFEGCPPPPAVYDKISSIDSGDNHYTISDLAVSEDSVRENFLKYRVLDERVKFRKGWFHETMPEVAKEINKIAILRLDGDLYVSTLPVLQAMYDKVSIGGYIMLDDVGLRGFDTALEEFRLSNNITTPITHVANSHNVCYWIKE